MDGMNGIGTGSAPGAASLSDTLRAALDKLNGGAAHALGATDARSSAQDDASSAGQGGSSNGDTRAQFGKDFGAAGIGAAGVGAAGVGAAGLGGANQAGVDSTAAAAQNAATAQTALHDAASAISTAAANIADPAALAGAAAAAAAAQPGTAANAALNANTPATTQALAATVGTPAWEQELSQKVVFLSTQHQSGAELTLNPPGLGPLQVSLRVADDSAHAQFVSQHAQVRDAVEAALPQLRDALKASGLTLGSASVSDNAFASAQQNPQQQYAGNRRQPDERGIAGVGGTARAAAARTADAAATTTTTTTAASAIASGTGNTSIDTFA